MSMADGHSQCVPNRPSSRRPRTLFAEIRTIAQASPEPLFREAIENLLVDDVFECIGKIRNAQALGIPTAFPTLVLKFVQAVTMAVGVANRQYTTGTQVISEAMALPDLPDGVGELGQIILFSTLQPPCSIRELIDRSFTLLIWNK